MKRSIFFLFALVLLMGTTLQAKPGDHPKSKLTTAQNALPANYFYAQLNSISISRDTRGYILNWVTGWEQDNDMFRVELSLDGGQNWRFAGEVFGGINSDEPINYFLILPENLDSHKVIQARLYFVNSFGQTRVSTALNVEVPQQQVVQAAPQD